MSLIGKNKKIPVPADAGFVEDNQLKNRRILIYICNAFAAVCYGIVSYGYFNRGRTGLGLLFAALTLSQIVMAYINYRIDKNR